MSSGWLDLSSLVAGLAGTILLSLAVGVPPGSAANMSAGGKYYKIAFMFPGRLRWGIRFIILAFVLQLMKVILGFVRLR